LYRRGEQIRRPRKAVWGGQGAAFGSDMNAAAAPAAAENGNAGGIKKGLRRGGKTNTENTNVVVLMVILTLKKE
jgi:hypothetical protein